MQTDNPFVGPRPLTSENRIFGRDHEIADLFHLVMAERIVLFHSPSGAGKSSLLNAGLIPELTGRFDVWTATRVNTTPPPDLKPLNRYAWSAMMGLEEGVPKSARRSPEALASMTLKDYAISRPCPPDASPNKFLIFDQFEEIVRAASEDVAAQSAFFLQLSELLALPNVWVLFSVREDYLAPLLPLAAMLPTHLRARYRLDFLNVAQAKLVMKETAALGGRTVHPAVVDALVENLAAARFQTKNSAVAVQSLEANYVEPMHLQVVCRRLWDDLPPADRSIDPADVAVCADVSRFLGDYYNSVIGAPDIAGDDLLRQRRIREWFHEKLIRDDIRSQIQMGATHTEGLPNDNVFKLLDAKLVRTEIRRGLTWVELAHDRLIEPVERANDEWFLANIDDTQRAAALWVRQDRNKGLLLTGAALAHAKAWRAANPSLVTPAEHDFISLSDDNEKAIAREAAQNTKLRRRFWIAMATLAMAVICAGVAINAWADADLERQNALTAQVEAECAREEAENSSFVANEAHLRADQMRDLAVSEAENAGRQEKEALRQKEIAENQKEEAVRQADIAKRAFAGTSAREAEMNIAVGREGYALAYLANALRADPANQAYRARLADLFLRSYWWLPVRRLADSEKPAKVLQAALHGNNEVSVIRHNGSLEHWNLNGSAPSSSKTLKGFSTRVWSAARFNRDFSRLLTYTNEGIFQVWSRDVGESLGRGESAGGPISTAIFFADSSRVLLVVGRFVKIWDVTQSKFIWTGTSDTPTEAAGMHPDGERFFFRKSRSSVEIVRLQNGAVAESTLITLPTQSATVAFTPDGKSLRVIVGSSKIQLRNLQTGELQRAELAPAGGVRQVVHCRTKDCPWVAILPTSSLEHAVGLWNISSGTEIQLRHLASPSLVQFNESGSLIATASNDRIVQVWKVASGERITRELHHDDVVTAIQFNRNNSAIAVTTNRGAVQIWDLASSQKVGVSFGGDQRLELARFRDSAVTALTIGADNSVSAWNVGLGDDSQILRELQTETGVPAKVSGATLTADGSWILTASADAGRVTLWDARTAVPKFKPIDVRQVSTKIKNAAVSRSGERVAVNYENGSVSLWDPNSRAELRKILQPGDRQLTTGFSLDGDTVLVAFTDGNLKIAKWSNKDPKPSILRIDGPSRAISISEDPKIPAKVSFSEDRRRLSVVANQFVQIWDVESGKPVGPDIESKYERDTLPAVSPDRRAVVTGLSANELRVSMWSQEPARLWANADLPRFRSPIVAVSWNGTSNRFATLTQSGEAQVWAREIRDTRDTFLPVGPTMILRGGTPVLSAFSYDSKRLLTVAKSSTVSLLQLWDIQTGIPIGRPLLHPGAVKRIEVSSDGRFFMIFGEDGFVRLVSNFVDSGSPAEAGLLSDLAEAVSGYRIENNLLKRIPDQWSVLQKLNQSINEMPDEPGKLEWYIRRFFQRNGFQSPLSAAGAQ